jgi:uncharacterized membrane protein
MKLIAYFLIAALIPLSLSSGVLAQEEDQSPQEEVLEGEVLEILEEGVTEQMGEEYLYQNLKILVTKGSLKDQEITVEAGSVPTVGQAKYAVGDEVLVNRSAGFEGEDAFYITGFIRRKPLTWLFLVFVVLAVAVGQWRGLSSLLGMGVSFLVIFGFILPNLSAGRDPILIVILGSLVVIPATFYLSHGFNRKTTVAMAGTFISLVITSLLAKLFVELTNLTGYASEEAAFLQQSMEGTINVKGLLLAGIIVGALGVLDDVTVSQAAIVQQLKEAGAALSPQELFSRAMSVGRDHIASMVNTLILVYTGAALPLLLLFIGNAYPFSQVINYEIITEELVRTLVGSIGLIAAVPITTLLAISLLTERD